MIITAITQQVKLKNRYSVYVDGKYSFSLSDQALLDTRIANGQELTAAELAALKKLSADDKIFSLSLRYALMRPRSEWELSDYLRRKQVSPDTAAATLMKLQKFDLVDDMAFARSWVENRRLLKATSRRKLSAELKQKHVASEVIDQVLAEDKQEIDEVAVLRQLVARKRARYPDAQKFMAYLARQGYSYDDIKSAISEENLD